MSDCTISFKSARVCVCALARVCVCVRVNPLIDCKIHLFSNCHDSELLPVRRIFIILMQFQIPISTIENSVDLFPNMYLMY